MWSGQTDAHAAFCELLIQSAEATADPVVAADVARAILINPEASESLTRQGAQCAVRAVDLEPTEWTRTLRGLAEYRLGNFAAAQEQLRSAPLSSDQCRVQAHAVLAMAAHKLNDPTTARSHLEKAESIYGLASLFNLESPFDVYVFEWLLVNEARAQVLGQPRSGAELAARIIAIQKAVIDLHPEDTHHRSQLAAIYLWFREDRAHLGQCHLLLEMAQGGMNPEDYDRAAKAYLVREDAAANPELLRRAVAAAYKACDLGMRYGGVLSMFQWCAGLAAYRSGNDKLAELYFGAALENPHVRVQAPALIYRSLSRLRQGRLAEARRDYEAAQRLMAPLPDRSKATSAVIEVNNMIFWFGLAEAHRAFAALPQD
jgi:tetratricopeptide (TPR) repeat protein